MCIRDRFLGFTNKLVIGVYVGFDEPQSLGKYETGAKAALPIFKNFVKYSIKKRYILVNILDLSKTFRWQELKFNYTALRSK